ncbi:MAG TPA: GxxExxY protein [Desulfobacterales bacterium]|nr:GxxExxY protein [Desulfobacterales bacterium]
MKHKELTAKIIECAYKVHNSLGFGFLEAVYQNALLIELLKAGLRAEKEKKIQVYPIVAKVENAAGPRHP